MAKTVRTRISSYTRNVAKSFGYAVTDIVGQYNPVISELMSESKDAAEDVYSQISDWHDNLSQVNIRKEFSETSKAIFGNLKEDLKTGNWYNKARQDKAFDAGKMMGMEDLDMDFNFDMDEDWGDGDSLDFDAGDDDAFSDDTKAAISEDKKNTAQIISSVDRVGYAVASSINEGQMATADYLAKTNSANAQAIYGLNQKGFATVNQAIMAVNENIIAIAKLGEPLTLHMQNSQTFFTNTSEQLKNIQKTLEDIKTNTTKVDPKGKGRSSDYTFESLLSGDVVSPSAYLDMIKHNFSNNKDMLDMAKDVIKGIDPKKLSPGVLITRTITGIMIPKMLKDTMSEFNESLKYYINDRFLKGQKSFQNGGIVGYLVADLLGLNVNTNAKKTFNTANYEKGPVAWDGVARKALTEVIPTSLMMIYSALTGAPQKAYDYSKGKFVSVSGVRDDFRREFVKNPAEAAGGELRREALKAAGGDAELSKDIEKFFISAFEQGDPYAMSILMQPGAAQKFGIKKSTVQKLRTIVRKHNRLAMKYSTNMTIQRDRAGQRMSEYEADGASIYAAISNGGLHEGGSLKGGMFADGSGNDIFGYMKDIRADIKLIVKNLYGRSLEGFDNARGNRYAMMHQNAKKGNNFAGGGFTGAGERKFNESKRTGSSDLSFGTGSEDKNRNKEIEEELKKSGLKGAIKDKVGKYLMEYGISPKGIMAAPFNIANSVLSSLSAAMTRAIIGEDDDPESGLFGNILSKAESMFKEFFEGFKNKFTQIWDKIFGTKDEDGVRRGGALSGFYNDTKKTLKGYAKTAKGVYSEAAFGDKDYLDKIKNLSAEQRKLQLDNATLDRLFGSVDQAANGRRITRTGLVAVSEGELIIPAERNPYYHGAINKARQYRNEANIARRFYGSFADGGTPIGGGYTLYESKPDVLEPGMIYKIGNNQFFKVTNELNKDGSYKKVAIKGDEVRRLGLEQRSANDKRNQEIKNQKSSIRKSSTGIIGGTANAFGDAVNNVVDAAREFAGQLSGENIGKKGAPLSEKIHSLLEDAGAHRGELGAGAVLGGLGGTLVGSPILGAIVGSTISYVSHSETAKEVLFGAKGEDGKYHDTLLSNVGNFMEQSLPDMGKGALLGGTAGLLLGSPILGAVAGSAVGYVKSSDAAKKLLFGEQDENGQYSGGPLSKAKNFLNKHGKAIGIDLTTGAIGGLIGGPFGVAGGLLVGVGVNYLRDSQRVHNWLFGSGKDKKGGFLGKIHEYGKNLGKSITGWLKVQGILLGNRLKSMAGGLFNFAKKAIGNLVPPTFKNKLGKAAEFLSPTKLVGKLSDRRKARNIRRGYGAYDRNLGRDMTAAEQLEYMEANGLSISDSQRTFLTQVSGLKTDKDREMFGTEMDDIINDKSGKYSRTQKKLAIMAKDQSKRDVRIGKQQEAAKSDTEKVGDKITETLHTEVDRVVNAIRSVAGQSEDGLIQTTTNNQGEIIYDTNDKETKAALANRETRMKAYESLSRIGDSDSPFIKGLKNIFTSTTDENGEEHPSIFSKLISAVSGGFKSVVGFISKNLGSIIGAALLAAIATGKGNDFASKLTGGAYGATQNAYTGSNGEALSYDEETGTYKTADGETYTGFISGKKAGADTIQTRLFKNAGREVARNAGRAMQGKSLRVGKSVAGRAVNRITKGGVGKVYKAVESGEAMSKLDEAFGFVKKVLQKVAPKAMAGIDDFISAIKGKVAAKIGTKAGALTKAIPVVGQAIAIAMGVADFTTGYQDARTTFKITQEPTTGQRVASGVIRVVKNLTGIGAFIPDSVIIDVFVKFLAPHMGIDTEELTNAREAAQKEVDSYNSENGTNLTVEEYNKQVLGDYTWTEKIGNGFKSAGATIKNGVASIKEKGLSHAMKEAGKSFGETKFGQAMQKADMTFGFVNATKLAADGDVKGLFKWVADGNGEKEGVGGVINTLGKLPRTLIAIKEIPVLIGGLLKSLFKSETRDIIKEDAGKFQSAMDQVSKFSEQGQVMNAWKVDFKPSSDNKFGFLFSLGFGAAKLVGTVGAFVNKLKNSFAGWIASKFTWLKNWILGKDTSEEKESSTAKEGGGASGVKREKDGAAIPSFVSQFDTRYKDIPMTGGTFAQKGCGPAVASMLSTSFGKELDVPTAIAASGQYQSDQGVSTDYFKDVLGSQGIGINPIQTDPKNMPNAILRRLAKGQKVILLGQDPSNRSKKNSPFGPTPHYVLATGIDQNGNVIINDPESMGPKSYSSNILSAATNGIETYQGVGAGGEMNTEVAQKVWAYFRGQGFSEAATSAIMGNLYAESGMQPESIQGGGKGPAAGIAQWENYNNKSSRWAALNNFASSMGRNWTDLDAQLQFISKEIGTNDFAQRISGQLAKSNLDKAGTTGISFGDFKKTSDIDNATKQFEAAFERAGTPHMDRRIDAAKQYYKLFTGKDIPYTASSVSATSSDGENDVANGQKPTGIARLMSLVGDITSAIGGIFGKSTSSSTAIADATSTGSDVSGFSFAEGAAPVDFMKGILGKIQYSMTGPRDPEQGSADCSSTVQWAVKKATGLDIGSTTGIQYNSPNLTPVWYDNGNFLQSYPGNLQPNDVIFFQRKGGDSDKGSALDHVGHVALFEGDVADENNPYYDEEAAKKSGGKPVYKYIDHGWGVGPKESEMGYGGSKNGQIIKISRLPAGAVDYTPATSMSVGVPTIKSIGKSATSKATKSASTTKKTTSKGTKAGNRTAFASGSGLYSDIAKSAGGSRGTLLRRRPGDSVYGSIGFGSGSSLLPQSGGMTANNILASTKSMLSTVTTNATSRANNGRISSQLLTKLISAITAVLQSIANNTAPVQQIYELLAAYTSASTTNQQAQIAAATASAKQIAEQNNKEVSDSFINLVGVLAEIAKG